MKFYLVDRAETKEMTVIRWEGTDYGPDCFDDLEVNFPRRHVWDEEKQAYMCTSHEFEQLREWWTAEIAAWNRGGTHWDSDYSDCADPDITLFTGRI